MMDSTGEIFRIEDPFLPARRSKRGNSYGNVSGWVAPTQPNTLPWRWVAGCPSHSGIVSKRLNLSENFFDRLNAALF